LITGDFNALYILGKLQYTPQARPDKSNMVLYSKNRRKPKLAAATLFI